MLRILHRCCFIHQREAGYQMKTEYTPKRAFLLSLALRSLYDSWRLFRPLESLFLVSFISGDAILVAHKIGWWSAKFSVTPKEGTKMDSALGERLDRIRSQTNSKLQNQSSVFNPLCCSSRLISRFLGRSQLSTMCSRNKASLLALQHILSHW